MRAMRSLVKSMWMCGILLAGVRAAGAFCVGGTYNSTPVVSYNCAFGIVDFTVSSWTFQVLGGNSIQVTATPGGTLPVMIGTMDCAASSFSVSRTNTGACSETYSLMGFVDAAGHWTGTFRATLSGASCFGCATQTWSVQGTNPSADVPPPDASAESLELAAIPNPTYGPTLLRFNSPGTNPVTLEVFDLAGRRVDLLADHVVMPGGTQHVLWEPAPLGRGASGLRFAKLTIGNRATLRKIVILR